MNLDKLKEKIKSNFYIILIILLAYIGIKLIDNANLLATLYNFTLNLLWPFLLAFIIAYILNPLMRFLETKCNLSRGISLLITFIVVSLIVAFCIVYVLPEVISNIKALVNSIPDMVTIADNWLQNNLSIDLANKLAKKLNLIQNIGEWSTKLFNTALSSLVTFTLSVFNWIFALIIAAYYLYYKEMLLKSSRKFIFFVFRENLGKKFLTFIHSVHYMLSTYLWVRAVESTIVAIACFIGLIFIHSKYIVLISIVFGVTNMIPYFGPFIGIVFGTILNLFISPMKAFIILIYLFILQQIDGNWLGPKMSSNSVGINPIACLFAITVGGKLYGMFGMLLAVPIAGVIKIYYDKFFKKYNNNHPEIMELIDNYEVDITELKLSNPKSIKSSFMGNHPTEDKPNNKENDE
ncbi:AI-2E family transporter [Clostridium ihumii]|uniref:AI-2E family transporter n=1 Tax=Clostridium ihumii TaxID=1470356 RepID=UPI0006852CA3|nr:AI-2E family transporter [Clostridium ihumii]